MHDMFAKLLHVLATLPFDNTRELTVTLSVVGDHVRLLVLGA